MNFLRRCEILSSELSVNRLLSEKNVQMQRSAVNNAQYHLRKSLEINLFPTSINDEVFESNVCKALSLNGHEVKPDETR